MAQNDIYRVDVVWETIAGVFYGENVLHFRQNANQVQVTPTLDLAVAMEEDFIPAMAPFISPSFQSQLVRVRGVTTPTEGTDHQFTPVIGSVTLGDTYDFRTGALIHWRTALVGRSFRGRTTLPAATEAVIDGGGLFQASFRTNLGIAAVSVITLEPTLTHGGWRLGVLSRFSEGVERPTPLFTEVTTAVVNVRPGMLRERAS